MHNKYLFFAGVSAAFLIGMAAAIRVSAQERSDAGASGQVARAMAAAPTSTTAPAAYMPPRSQQPPKDLRTQVLTPQTADQKIAALQNAVAELQTQVEVLQQQMAKLPPADKILSKDHYGSWYCNTNGTISPNDIITRARIHIAAVQGKPDYYSSPTMMIPYWDNCRSN